MTAPQCESREPHPHMMTPTIRRKVGWLLMGYPFDVPGWRRIYRLGARLMDGAGNGSATSDESAASRPPDP